jgi:16S rRNA (uracil1498-N3)-methyltransferase
MTRRRFYAPTVAFAPDERSLLLGADETRHLRDVLRSRAGDEVYVFDGDGREFRCEVAAIEREGTQLNVLEEVTPASPESPINLTLVVALLKGEKFELVLQKATELGVSRVIPLEAQRADVKLHDTHDGNKRVTRWQRIALEAAKQSGRARVPQISAPQGLASILAQLSKESPGNHVRLMLSERGGESWEPAIGGFDRPQTIIALVGPEGGWTDEEIDLARQANFHIVTLGGRMMRAETAAVVITALLQHRFGDLI